MNWTHQSSGDLNEIELPLGSRLAVLWRRNELREIRGDGNDNLLENSNKTADPVCVPKAIPKTS